MIPWNCLILVESNAVGVELPVEHKCDVVTNRWIAGFSLRLKHGYDYVFFFGRQILISSRVRFMKSIQILGLRVSSPLACSVALVKSRPLVFSLD